MWRWGSGVNELHICAGHGGGILGGMLLGHTCRAAIEISQYRRMVLLQRQRDGILPKFPIWDNIETFDGNPWNRITQVVCAGWPCDDLSTAGKMLGIDGPKSGLWRHVSRIIGEVRPSYVFLENTPAIVILGLFRVLGDLATLGYDARWAIIGGSDAGMDTDGPRFWLLAKAPGKGWPSVLQSEQGINRKEGIKSKSSDYANPPSVIERIRKHESRCGQPAILGELDGLANRVERLEAIGQGQIPSLVKLAWETLSQS